MDNILIRRATTNDIKTIQQLGFELLDFERQNWDHTLDPNWPFTEEGKQKYLAAIKSKYTIIAEANNKPVGYLIGEIIDASLDSARPINQAYIKNIYVKDSARKSGIGTMLIDDFKNYCRANNVKRLNVSVLAANTAAIKLYQKSGFSTRSLNLFQEL